MTKKSAVTRVAIVGDLNIFNAAHAIKGSAGLFGFDHVVAFTHVAESVPALGELLVRCGTLTKNELDAALRP